MADRRCDYSAMIRSNPQPWPQEFRNAVLAAVGLQRLVAEAIARVAGGVGNGLILVMTKVLGHLSFKSPLDEHLGELLQETILADQVFGLGVIGHEAFGEFLQIGIGFGLGALACGYCGSLMLAVCCQMTVYTQSCTPSLYKNG